MGLAAFQLMHVLKCVNDTWSVECDHMAADWRVVEAVENLARMQSSNQTLLILRLRHSCDFWVSSALLCSEFSML